MGIRGNFLRFVIVVLGSGPVSAQGPRLRYHTAVESGNLVLLPADRRANDRNSVTIQKNGPVRKVDSNAIPEHLVGPFPNRGNPNTIRPQAIVIDLPADPRPAGKVTWIHGDGGLRRGGPLRFGIALNGVLFDPGAAEFFKGDPALGWQYEALSGAIPLGLDENYAHVQPTGNYHYHGIPTGLLKRLGFTGGKHSPLVGWAADGFPIYAWLGFAEARDVSSEIVELKSSYRLREGQRPGGSAAPGGRYDGAFVRDYEFVEGSGDLDECNGRFCVTPEFPEGTYAYFLTRDWPVIPRGFRGTPVVISEGFGEMPGGGRGKGKGKGPKGPKGKGFPPPFRPK